MSEKREPIFNIPTVVVVILAVLGLLHAFRIYWLSPEADRLLLLNLAFVPARYDWNALLSGSEIGPSIWTFVTHALVHADLMHLGFNAVWLVAFGSAVARRFGTLRTVVFFAVTAAAGAFAHLVTHFGELQLMIGASGAVSGTMGAAARFAFQRNGPLDPWSIDRERAYRNPAPPLFAVLRNPRVLAFVGAWFALNLLFGLGSWSIIGEEHGVAWEAHVGGFLAGLLLFSLFDPVDSPADIGDDESEPVVS